MCKSIENGVRTKLVDLGMTHCHFITDMLALVEDTGRQTQRKDEKRMERERRRNGVSCYVLLRVCGRIEDQDFRNFKNIWYPMVPHILRRPKKRSRPRSRTTMAITMIHKRISLWFAKLAEPGRFWTHNSLATCSWDMLWDVLSHASDNLTDNSSH